MTLQFERKYSTQGLGAPCHVSFRLTLSLNLRFDLRLGGYIPYGMRFFESHFPYGLLFKKSASTIEDLQEKNSRTLGNYSRRLQDYSRISWSTFQTPDA
jgi:hypothetical protein